MEDLEFYTLSEHKFKWTPEQVAQKYLCEDPKKPKEAGSAFIMALMKFQAQVLVCLAAILISANAQTVSQLKTDLDSQINTVCNSVLGTPCKVSPPPPVSSPPPPGSSPPPPASSPPPPASSPPPPASSPPPPASAPTPAPASAPTPAPTLGLATGVVTLFTASDQTLTGGDQALLLSLLSAATSGNGVAAGTGRRRSLLDTYTLAFTVGGVTNCATLATALSNYIQSGQFVSQSDGLLIGAVLTSFSCTGAGSVSFDNPAIPPPSQAPSSAPVPGVAPEPGVAPAPAGLGVASGSFTVNTMAGVQLSAAQQTELIGAIQQQVGDNGVVTQVAGPGRKLLDTITIYFIITGVTSDTLVVDIVTSFIQNGGLVSVANNELSIPLLSATLNTITATGAGPTVSVTIPTPGPAPAAPAPIG